MAKNLKCVTLICFDWIETKQCIIFSLSKTKKYDQFNFHQSSLFCENQRRILPLFLLTSFLR